jgi:hypothetical protein
LNLELPSGAHMFEKTHRSQRTFHDPFSTPRVNILDSRRLKTGSIFY